MVWWDWNRASDPLSDDGEWAQAEEAVRFEGIGGCLPDRGRFDPALFDEQAAGKRRAACDARHW